MILDGELTVSHDNAAITMRSNSFNSYLIGRKMKNIKCCRIDLVCIALYEIELSLAQSRTCVMCRVLCRAIGSSSGGCFLYGRRH